MKKLHKIVLVSILFFVSSPLFSQIKREREESPQGIDASNTMGFGNVWMRGNALMFYRENSGARIEPYGAGGIGLANNLSVWGGAVVFEGSYKRLIGKADAHVRATLPYNDNFRFFGIGVQGDLILSSDADTFSSHTDTSRPAYTPIIGFTVMADFEIMKLVKTLPLKVYINLSTIDDDRLLSEWKQESYRFAIEWKSERNSYYGGGRFGRYSKRHIKENTENNISKASLVTAFAGLRFRPLDRVALLITGLFSVPMANGPDFVRYGIMTGLEMPLFFRETNAEAIRSLAMMENSKSKPTGNQQVRRNVTSVESLFLNEVEGFGTVVSEDDSTSAVVDEKERLLQEKRKNINDELKGIEALLE